MEALAKDRYGKVDRVSANAHRLLDLEHPHSKGRHSCSNSFTVFTTS